MCFDDDKKEVPVLEELKVIREIVDEMQLVVPHFDVRLILSGLKLLGT